MSTNKYQFSSMVIENECVKKVMDVKRLLLSLLLLCIAVCMVAVSSLVKFDSDIVTMLLLSCGGILLVFSVYLLLNKIKKVIYLPTGSAIKHYFCYIEPSQLVQAEKWAEGGFKSFCDNLKKRNDGNVRLDACLSQDGKFAAAQLSIYENFRYVSHYSVTYLYDDNVNTVSSFFKE